MLYHPILSTSSPVNFDADAAQGSLLLEGTTSSRPPMILCLASAYSSSLCLNDFTFALSWLKFSSEDVISGWTSGLFIICSGCFSSSLSSLEFGCFLLSTSGAATTSGRFKIVTFTSEWISSSANPSWDFEIGGGSRGGWNLSLGGGTLRFKFFREVAVSSTNKGLGIWRRAIGGLRCVTVKARSATAWELFSRPRLCKKMSFAEKLHHWKNLQNKAWKKIRNLQSNTCSQSQVFWCLLRSSSTLPSLTSTPPATGPSSEKDGVSVEFLEGIWNLFSSNVSS